MTDSDITLRCDVCKQRPTTQKVKLIFPLGHGHIAFAIPVCEWCMEKITENYSPVKLHQEFLKWLEAKKDD